MFGPGGGGCLQYFTWRHGGEVRACDITNMHRDVASGGGGHLTFSLYLYI